MLPRRGCILYISFFFPSQPTTQTAWLKHHHAVTTVSPGKNRSSHLNSLIAGCVWTPAMCPRRWALYVSEPACRSFHVTEWHRRVRPECTICPQTPQRRGWNDSPPVKGLRWCFRSLPAGRCGQGRALCSTLTGTDPPADTVMQLWRLALVRYVAR